MSSSGGFWPGDPPADDEENEERPQQTAGFDEPPTWPAPSPEIEATDVARAPAAREPEPAPEPMFEEPEPQPEPEPEPDDFVSRAFAAAERLLAESPPPSAPPPPNAPPPTHASGELTIPDGVAVLEGSPAGAERTVGVVVSRFNGEITNRLLESAIGELVAAGVPAEQITVMPVPGAFELPIGAMALAKTRRYSCVVALGCIVRGETPHFDFVATEAASGLQLAGLETGVPVAFGVLTVDTVAQAEARTGRGADAARTALEMADLFAQVRAQAKAAK